MCACVSCALLTSILPPSVSASGDYTCCPSGSTCKNAGSGWSQTTTCVAADGTSKAPGEVGGGQQVCKTGGPLAFSTTKKNVVILGDSVSIGYEPHVAGHMSDYALEQVCY